MPKLPRKASTYWPVRPGPSVSCWKISVAVCNRIREQMRLIYDMQSRGWEDVKAIRELSDKVEKNTDRIAENTREIKEVAGKISENTRGTVDALEGTINVKVKM